MEECIKEYRLSSIFIFQKGNYTREERNIQTYWTCSKAWMYFNVASRILLFKSKDNLSWPYRRIWSKFSFMRFVSPWGRNIAIYTVHLHCLLFESDTKSSTRFSYRFWNFKSHRVSNGYTVLNHVVLDAIKAKGHQKIIAAKNETCLSPCLCSWSFHWVILVCQSPVFQAASKGTRKDCLLFSATIISRFPVIKDRQEKRNNKVREKVYWLFI